MAVPASVAFLQSSLSVCVCGNVKRVTFVFICSFAYTSEACPASFHWLSLLTNMIVFVFVCAHHDYCLHLYEHTYPFNLQVCTVCSVFLSYLIHVCPCMCVLKHIIHIHCMLCVLAWSSRNWFIYLLLIVFVLFLRAVCLHWVMPLLPCHNVAGSVCVCVARSVCPHLFH